jgi:hypothetical protein
MGQKAWHWLKKLVIPNRREAAVRNLLFHRRLSPSAQILSIYPRHSL